MKFNKPGKHRKKKEKMPSPPLEKYCRRCYAVTKTEAWRHAESRIIKMEYGGGIMGSRIPNDKTAWLCANCDNVMSQPLSKNAGQSQLKQHAEEWERLIKLSR